jgi:predicted ArsR family transcriptional regulator
MTSSDLADRVTAIAALADPTRRDLYLYVSGEAEPVSRDQAAEVLGIARHSAKFHLDRLVEEGLLQTDFKRLSGRQGPGAGRPTKLYTRSGEPLSVTLPERRYDLAGQLLATAIDASTGDRGVVTDALHVAAADWGRTIGEQARAAAGPRPSRDRIIGVTCDALAEQGYEPRRDGGTITMSNCPFDALARTHTALVCGMNLAIMTGVTERVGGSELTARLEPHTDRCCVVLDAE